MIRVRTVGSLGEVPAAAWDAVAGGDNPFVTHAFLHHLEQSGAVGGRTGQVPAHLVAEEDGVVVGAAPLYLKNHSHGEYIFDWGWADAARRAGIAYYPKLVGAVPYTPAAGPRLLAAGARDPDAVRRALASAAWAEVEAGRARSLHWLFVPEDDIPALQSTGHVRRASWQYHLRNEGYRDLDDLLERFNSKRRKEVRRERRAARETGLDLAVEPLGSLSEEDLWRLHACYLRTIEQYGAIAYLPTAWWEGLGEALGPWGVVATARRGRLLVAASLAFEGRAGVFGRYWGALEPVGMVHFELCYYLLVEHALRRGAPRVEAGAQGEHKIPRGFLPSPTWSAHRLQHPGLDAAVRSFVAREADHVGEVMQELSARSPFRSEGVG